MTNQKKLTNQERVSYYLSFWQYLPESLKTLSSLPGKYTGGGESWGDFTFYVLRVVRIFDMCIILQQWWWW